MDTIFRVWSDSFEDGKPIPEGFAFAKPDPMGKEHTLPAGNRNPQIAWSNPPLGTKSLIVICEDNDVPADFPKPTSKEKRFRPMLREQALFTGYWLISCRKSPASMQPRFLKASLPAAKEGRPVPTACARDSTTIPMLSKATRTTKDTIMAMTVRALRGTMNEFTAMSLLFTQSTFRCCPSRGASTAEMS